MLSFHQIICGWGFLRILSGSSFKAYSAEVGGGGDRSFRASAFSLGKCREYGPPGLAVLPALSSSLSSMMTDVFSIGPILQRWC